MKKLVFISILYLIYFYASELKLNVSAFNANDSAASAMLSLGLITIFAWYLGDLVQKIKLPAITGYLFAGFIFGPHLLSQVNPSLVILDHNDIAQLKLINELALGIIALTAGGELRLHMIKKQWKSLFTITFAQVFIVIIAVSSVSLLANYLFPPFAKVPFQVALGVCLLLGVIATAKSPATTIAIINECQSQGPVTEIALGVTVIKDMVVIAIFTVILACSELLIIPGAQADFDFLGLLFWEIIGSIGVGCLVGWFLATYVDHINKELPLVIMAASFLSMTMFHEIHLSGLLVCMIAGFFVENFSKHGDALIHAIEEHSFFIYVLFFSIAGASLDVPAFLTVWPVALFLVIVRLLFTYVGTSVPAKLSGAELSVQKYAWLGFISQAGVSLGLAIVIEKAFIDVPLPGSTSTLGPLLKTIILGTIVINQMLGPIAFKYALGKANEIGKRKQATPLPQKNKENARPVLN